MAPRVLVVDDEEVFADLARDQLGARGFEVAVASSGEEALAAAAENPPDVILLDVLLPGLAGDEVLRRLKSDPRTKAVPVVVCSVTLRERVAQERLLALGASAFVSKPCKPDDLAARLREVLPPT